MNKNLLVGFIVILVVLLGIPMLGAITRGQSSSAASTPPAATAPAQQPAQQEQPIAEEPQVQAQPQQPRVLTAQDLVGTAWEINSEYGAVQVQLNAGGQAVATHPMVGQLNGSWRVNGNQVVAKVSFMNQTQTFTAQICGDTLCVNGAAIRRLR